MAKNRPRGYPNQTQKLFFSRKFLKQLLNFPQTHFGPPSTLLGPYIRIYRIFSEKSSHMSGNLGEDSFCPHISYIYIYIYGFLASIPVLEKCLWVLILWGYQKVFRPILRHFFWKGFRGQKRCFKRLAHFFGQKSAILDIYI